MPMCKVIRLKSGHTLKSLRTYGGNEEEVAIASEIVVVCPKCHRMYVVKSPFPGAMA
jgi:hypothetical protein